MAILSDRDRAAVQKEFEKLANPVKLTVFSQELGSETCRQTESLIKEVAQCSDKLSVEVLNLILDRERAAAYGVDRVPAVVVEGEQDYGIRFFGLPGGYEFSNLIDSVIAVSTGQPALAPETQSALAGLPKPVHIQVFTTPTWPHCPRAVRLAQHMAVASSQVRADCIEANEFPELSRYYRVMAVPKVVINDRVEFEGALPEKDFLAQVLRAADGDGASWARGAVTRLLRSLALLLLAASPALAEPLAVGVKAPDFTLSDQEGRPVRLGDLLARRPFVVLAFYVKAFTSGWTLEFSRFRDDKAKFDALGAEVVGLSADSPADNRAWAAELKLPFRLLSDLGPKGKVSKTYGVWDDLWELSKRATFIIDRQGTIRYVDAGGLAIDTKRVLEALQRLPRASQ